MSTAAAGERAGVALVEIGEDEAGQRLDNFLLARLKGVPKSRVYRLLRKGEVRVNKGRARPEYRLAAGDRIRLPPLQRKTEEQRAAERTAELLVVERRDQLPDLGELGLAQSRVRVLRQLPHEERRVILRLFLIRPRPCACAPRGRS